MIKEMPDCAPSTWKDADRQRAAEVKEWFANLAAELEQAAREVHEAWGRYRDKDHECMIYVAETEKECVSLIFQIAVNAARGKNPELFREADRLQKEWNRACIRHEALKREWDFALVYLRRSGDPG